MAATVASVNILVLHCAYAVHVVRHVEDHVAPLHEVGPGQADHLQGPPTQLVNGRNHVAQDTRESATQSTVPAAPCWPLKPGPWGPWGGGVPGEPQPPLHDPGIGRFLLVTTPNTHLRVDCCSSWAQTWQRPPPPVHLNEHTCCASLWSPGRTISVTPPPPTSDLWAGQGMTLAI